MIKGVGATRKNSRNHANEDYFIANDSEQIFIVCDGISRDQYSSPDRSCSAEVSRLFAETVERNLSENRGTETPGETLYRSIVSGSEEIARYNREHYPSVNYLDRDFAATVATCVWIKDHTAYIAHIGDCRACLYRNGSLADLTVEQTIRVSEYRKKNGFNDEASLFIRKNCRNNIASEYGYGALTGESSAFDFLIQRRVSLLRGDVLFLMSDGLFGFFASENVNYDDDCERILESSGRLQYANCDDDKTIVRISVME